MFEILKYVTNNTLNRLTVSISRRADCVENPVASRHTSKRVSPPPARAKGAVGLDAMLARLSLQNGMIYP
jgi:hypothetical protein